MCVSLVWAGKFNAMPDAVRIALLEPVDGDSGGLSLAGDEDQMRKDYDETMFPGGSFPSRVYYKRESGGQNGSGERFYLAPIGSFRPKAAQRVGADSKRTARLSAEQVMQRHPKAVAAILGRGGDAS